MCIVSLPSRLPLCLFRSPHDTWWCLHLVSAQPKPSRLIVSVFFCFVWSFLTSTRILRTHTDCVRPLTWMYDMHTMWSILRLSTFNMIFQDCYLQRKHFPCCAVCTLCLQKLKIHRHNKRLWLFRSHFVHEKKKMWKRHNQISIHPTMSHCCCC